MSKESTSTGIGFLGILTIVFITLKLVGVITWSWWWVLGAFWIPLALAAIPLTLLVLSNREKKPSKNVVIDDLPNSQRKKSAFKERLEAAMEAKKQKGA